MKKLFEEICSIYSDALDNVGRYVDIETGECIQQMSIRDFCLTDRWKPQVSRLRQMISEHGMKAKKLPEYIATKKLLPGATLSGLFDLRPDECLRKDGTKFIAPVSRRESHLLQHTGWLAIDIDLADNQHLSDFESVRQVCKFRPEIALLMRSCSGTGYFGLIRLAYPEEHKAQFKALMREYAAIGIALDKSCSNIGRVRFASWDDPDHIILNEHAHAYTGIDREVFTSILPTASLKAALPHTSPNGSALTTHPHTPDSPEIIYLKASRLVSKIEARAKDIMGSYYDWIRVGMALYHIDPASGYDLWKRVSRFRPPDTANGHHERDFRNRWQGFASSKINAETFFWYCQRADITLSPEEYREIYQHSS